MKEIIDSHDDNTGNRKKNTIRLTIIFINHEELIIIIMSIIVRICFIYFYSVPLLLFSTVINRYS